LNRYRDRCSRLEGAEARPSINGLALLDYRESNWLAHAVPVKWDVRLAGISAEGMSEGPN
jgi:hypothetical protein